MCIFRNKWQKFEPNKQYLSIVSRLTSVAKLHAFLKQFKWQGEKGDHWKTPMEFLLNKDKNIDCEDFARFAVDVLVRIIKIVSARFIIQSGYDKSRWGNKVMYHAICVFPYQGKLAVFSNNVLHIGLSSYEMAGYITFPSGLKYQEVRDWKGNILEKKRQWIGTF